MQGPQPEGPEAGDRRLELAEEFLREAAFRSRAKQAAGAALAAGGAPPGTTPGGCGLGERAAVELGLSAEGARLFARLWPAGPDADELARTRRVSDEWVRQQDALDRRRNHFLRDFRQAHGADRRIYAAEVAAAFERGLADVNAEETARRRRAARELLGLPLECGAPPPAVG